MIGSPVIEYVQVGAFKWTPGICPGVKGYYKNVHNDNCDEK